MRRSKKTSKLHVTGLYEGNSPVTGEFPSQRAINAENVIIWWRHRVNLCWRPYCFKTISLHKLQGLRQWKKTLHMYRQTSYISCKLVSHTLVDRSDVFGASPVGAAPTTSSLTPGFNGLGKDKCMTRRGTFKFSDLVRFILEVWRWCIVSLTDTMRSYK